MGDFLRPRYESDSDYTTNAPSYYDDLARKQKLIKLLSEKIWEYDNRLNERLDDLQQVLNSYLEQWDERIENLDEEVSHIFVTWLNDGTLEQIINHDVLGNKADQSELDKIAITPEKFGAVGDGVADDTSAIQSSINYVTNIGGGRIIFGSKTYAVNKLAIVKAENIELDFQGSTLLYNGPSEITNNYADGKLLRIERSKNITINNLTAIGRMFWSLDKTNLPTTPVKNIYTDNDKHISVYILDSEYIFVNKPKLNDFATCIYAGGECHNIHVNGGEISDTFFGVRMFKAQNSSIKNLTINDARYSLANTPEDTPVNTIGAGGTGVLLWRVKNVIVDNVTANNTATDSFRIQDGSKKVLIINCKAYLSRRHGFSVYGGKNEVTFEKCVTERTADSTFWNGSDNENTFRRPIDHTSGVSYVVTGYPETEGANDVKIVYCKAKEKVYTLPPSQPSVNNYYNATMLNRLLQVLGKQHVSVLNSEFTGHTRIEAVDWHGENGEILNNKFNGNEYLGGVVTRDNTIIKVYGDNNLISQNKLNGALNGIYSYGNYNVITHNIVKDVGGRGIYILENIGNYLSDNLVHNASMSGVDIPAYQYANTKDTVNGKNTAIDGRTTKLTNPAFTVSNDNTNFEPGEMIAIGIKDTISTNVDQRIFMKKRLGKMVFQGANASNSFISVRDEFNLLLEKLKKANLMDNDV